MGTLITSAFRALLLHNSVTISHRLLYKQTNSRSRLSRTRLKEPLTPLPSPSQTSLGHAGTIGDRIRLISRGIISRGTRLDDIELDSAVAFSVRALCRTIGFVVAFDCFLAGSNIFALDCSFQELEGDDGLVVGYFVA